MKARYLALFAIVTAFVSGPASSVTIETLYGDDVSFTYDKDTLFGSGTVIGNNIFFLPTDFSAESLNGSPGTVTANETLNVQIISTTGGYEMTDFALVESGDYLLNGSGSSVDVSGLFAVTSNTTLDPATAIPPIFPDGIEPYRDTSIFNGGALTVEGTLTEWDISTQINLADTAGWNSDTDVDMTIENLLTATTAVNGEQAFIEKKFGAVGIVVNPIPIPPALLLFPSALGVLAWMRRRKAAVSA